MEKLTLHGFLLKKTILSSGDGLLRFLTLEKGIVTIGFKKFENSQKRKQHIDFFRILECVVRNQKGYLKAEKCEGKAVFGSITKSYELTEKAFGWLESINKSFPEEKEIPEVFHMLSHCLHHVDPETIALIDTYFHIQILNQSGIMRRFDAIRSDVYLDPSTFHFSQTRSHSTNLFLPNQTRQFIEFLRRSSFEEIYQKRETLPLKSCVEANKTIQSLREYHI